MRDVIIVGAGGGGAVVAKELAQRGLDVLVLEAGPHHANPDVVSTPPSWSHYESAASAIFRWGAADPTKAPWRREIAGSSLALQTAGVGGTTLQYFANSPRAMPGAFTGYTGADKSAYDTAYLFPFSYSSLIPYYRWVEATLPVQTAALGTKEQVFIRGAEAIGLAFQRQKDICGDAFRPQENAILQPGGTAGLTSDPRLAQYPLATGCTFCGHCFQGCYMPRKAPRNLKAKRSTYNSYMPMALTADLWVRGGNAAKLISDAFVTQIHTQSTSKGLVACGVSFRIGATGEEEYEDAKVIVLAAGAVETPRLWLNSGLPNANGWVGAGLTTHATDVVTGIFTTDTNSSDGPASAVRADFPGRGSIESFGSAPGGEAALAFLSSEAGFAHATTDSAYGDLEGRLFGAALKDAMKDVNRLASIAILTDDDVDPSNKVNLSAAQPGDEHGPVPSISAPSSNFTPRTRANREYLVRKSVQLLRAAGAVQVLRANTPPALIHMHSTMRMGSDAATSVLDASGEARAVKGLYVADNSALANAIGGPNPTLTTQAIATRTSEEIFKKYFGGKAWVSKESPISSVAQVITNACITRGL